MATIYLQRTYDQPEHTDAYCVLVDRLWPRGIKKDHLHYDDWLKNIAPSNELRKWFGHEVAKWPEFQARYREELTQHSDELKQLLKTAGNRPLVLLFAAKDREHNNAVVIKAFLQQLADA